VKGAAPNATLFVDGKRDTRCHWRLRALLRGGRYRLSLGRSAAGQRTFNPGNGDFHLGQFVPHSSNLSAKTARLLGHITHLRIQRVEFVLNTVIVRLIRLPVSRQLLAEIAADDLGLTVDIVA